MSYYLNLNELQINDEEFIICIKNTGEIIEYDNLKQFIKPKELIILEHESFKEKDKTKTQLKRVDFIQINLDFIKRLIEQKQITLNDLGYLMLISQYVQFDELHLVDKDIVVLNNKTGAKKQTYLNKDSLCRKLKVSRPTLNSIINRLEGYNVIKFSQPSTGDAKKTILINPNFAFKGKQVKSTEYFQESFDEKPNKIAASIKIIQDIFMGNDIDKIKVTELGLLFYLVSKMNKRTQSVLLENSKNHEVFYKKIYKELKQHIKPEEFNNCISFFKRKDLIIDDEKCIQINPHYFGYNLSLIKNATLFNNQIK